MGRAILLLLLGCASCQSPAHSYFVGLPAPSAGARSAVFGRDLGHGLLVDAVDLESGELSIGPLDRGFDSLTVEARFYAATLSELGIAPGALAAIPDITQGRRMPPADLQVRLQIDEQTGPSAWQSTNAFSPAFDAFRIAALPSRCPTFTERVFPIEMGVLALFAVTLSSSFALVGTSTFSQANVSTSTRSLFLVSKDRAELLPTPPQGPFTSAVIDATGELWLGALGAIHHGGFDVGTRRFSLTTVAAPFPDAVAKLAVHHTAGSAPEIYALAKNGLFAYHDGVAWRSIPSLPDGRSGGWDTWLVALGPGEAYLISNKLPNPLRILNGRPIEEPLPEGTDGVATATVPRIGLLAGTARGSVFARRGETWVDLASPARLAVYCFGAYPGGFAYGADTGLAGVYLEGEGFCGEPTHHAGGSAIHFVTTLGEDLLLLPNRESLTNALVSVLVKQP